MVSKKKSEEQDAIEEESKELISTIKSNVNGFNKLLEDEKTGRKQTGDLKKKLQEDRLARQKMVI